LFTSTSSILIDPTSDSFLIFTPQTTPSPHQCPLKKLFSFDFQHTQCVFRSTYSIPESLASSAVINVRMILSMHQRVTTLYMVVYTTQTKFNKWQTIQDCGEDDRRRRGKLTLLQERTLYAADKDLLKHW
jgi:hypothetical protein